MVKNLCQLECKFDIDQSECKSSQVDASVHKFWPNKVTSQHKLETYMSTCNFIWPGLYICEDLYLMQPPSLIQGHLALTSQCFTGMAYKYTPDAAFARRSKGITYQHLSVSSPAVQQYFSSVQWQHKYNKVSFLKDINKTTVIIRSYYNTSSIKLKMLILLTGNFHTFI